MVMLKRELRALYKQSKAISFVLDYAREARYLKAQPEQAADAAHVSGTWNFDNPIEREWHNHVLEVVELHAADLASADCLEIGCSEGVFTSELAPRVRSICACDISRIAVNRAQSRCASFQQVSIRQLDFTESEILGEYDAVFVMDVLFFVLGRSRQSPIVTKLAKLVRPGGLLVFSDSRMPRGIRSPIFHLLFPTGADAWAKRLSRSAHLKVIHREVYPAAGKSIPNWWDKLFVIFRKEPAAPN